jgi:hypothetical protein
MNFLLSFNILSSNFNLLLIYSPLLRLLFNSISRILILFLSLYVLISLLIFSTLFSDCFSLLNLLTILTISNFTSIRFTIKLTIISHTLKKIISIIKQRHFIKFIKNIVFKVTLNFSKISHYNKFNFSIFKLLSKYCITYCIFR